MGYINMSVDYNKIQVHPLFDPIKKMFDFFILSIGFVGNPNFQTAFLRIHPAIAKSINEYNKEVNLRVSSDGSYTSSNKKFMTYVSRMMAILLFDFLQASKYQNKINSMPIYKFAKHLRNGAAHGNTFNFTEETIKKDQPITWRDKTIDTSLKGKPVTPDFITATELIFLMEDISKLLQD
jgi:hypothetical protein